MADGLQAKTGLHDLPPEIVRKILEPFVSNLKVARNDAFVRTLRTVAPQIEFELRGCLFDTINFGDRLFSTKEVKGLNSMESPDRKHYVTLLEQLTGHVRHGHFRHGNLNPEIVNCLASCKRLRYATIHSTHDAIGYQEARELADMARIIDTQRNGDVEFRTRAEAAIILEEETRRMGSRPLRFRHLRIFIPTKYGPERELQDFQDLSELFKTHPEIDSITTDVGQVHHDGYSGSPRSVFQISTETPGWTPPMLKQLTIRDPRSPEMFFGTRPRWFCPLWTWSRFKPFQWNWSQLTVLKIHTGRIGLFYQALEALNQDHPIFPKLQVFQAQGESSDWYEYIESYGSHRYREEGPELQRYDERQREFLSHLEDLREVKVPVHFCRGYIAALSRSSHCLTSIHIQSMHDPILARAPQCDLSILGVQILAEQFLNVTDLGISMMYTPMLEEHEAWLKALGQCRKLQNLALHGHEQTMMLYWASMHCETEDKLQRMIRRYLFEEKKGAPLSPIIRSPLVLQTSWDQPLRAADFSDSSSA